MLFAVFLCLLGFLGGDAEAGQTQRLRVGKRAAPRTTRTTYLGKGRKRQPIQEESIVQSQRGRLMEHEVINHELGTRHHVEHRKSGR